MINTQLHNQLIDIEIERKAIEAKKRVQEAKTQVLKERLRQVLYIAGFLFIVLLMLVALLWLLPNRSLKMPSFGDTNSEVIKNNKVKKTDSLKKEEQKKEKISQGAKKLFSGTEYVKENNYIYKRVYQDGILMKEEKLAPTITESKKLKKEDIPQFSTLKKSESLK
jgi:hypothetical protein